MGQYKVKLTSLYIKPVITVTKAITYSLNEVYKTMAALHQKIQRCGHSGDSTLVLFTSKTCSRFEQVLGNILRESLGPNKTKMESLQRNPSNPVHLAITKHTSTVNCIHQEKKNSDNRLYEMGLQGIVVALIFMY